MERKRKSRVGSLRKRRWNEAEMELQETGTAASWKTGIAEETCYFSNDIKRKKWSRKAGKERLHTGSWESTKICKKDSVR